MTRPGGRAGASACLALVAFAMLPHAARASDVPTRMRTCGIAGTKVSAHCGTVTVFENRATRTGRTIALNVIEIDALHRSGRAVFWNPGGPGAADASAVPYIARGLFARELMALHDRYDLVFVDYRGTGASRPIRCELYAPDRPEVYFAQLFPEKALRTCRAARARDTDLSAYTTDIAVDDLDDVRRALGYAKIVLDGGSYGTTYYLAYARRYPARVESLVLQGVAPPGIYKIPLPDAQGARVAMDAVIADCAHEAACHARYPALAAHFAALTRRFDLGPVAVPVRNAIARREQTVALSKEVFADRLRQALYANEVAAYVPYIVEAAYGHAYGPLARLVGVVTAGFDDGIGLNLSVTCAEDLPFIDEADIRRSSAKSFEGDARVRAQQRACAIWHVRRASPAFVRPVHSDAHILMISGAEDPATPPHYGRDALADLPNARQIVVPHASHESESACTDALIVRFVRTRDAKRLGAACVGDVKRPPFATSMNGFGS